MFVYRAQSARGPFVGIALSIDETDRILAGEVVECTEPVIPGYDRVLFAMEVPDEVPEAAHVVLLDPDDIAELQTGMTAAAVDLADEMDLDDPLIFCIAINDNEEEATQGFSWVALSSGEDADESDDSEESGES